MSFRRDVLSNGIRFIHYEVPGLKSATFTVWYGVGSRYEDVKVAGISHFLEHMAFKGGKKYPTAKAISETFDSLGVEDNASTGQEYTNYYVRAASTLLPRAVDVLADSLLSPVLDPKEIKKERGVIIEEINMYEDDPKDLVSLIYSNLIYPNHPLGRDIAGTKETVSSISREDFLDFRKTHYEPRNIVITVSGGVSYKNAYSLANEYFGQLKKSTYHNNYEHFVDEQTSPKLIVRDKNTEQANLVLGFLGKKHGDASRYAEALLGIILGAGMSSRLFREVREKRGLAYSVYASSSHFLDTGDFSAYAGVPVAKATDAISVILRELYRLNSKNHGITNTELLKAKAFFKGHMALSMENTRWINYFFGHEEIKGGDLVTPEKVFDLIDAVEISDILAVAKELFVPSKVNLAIVGPYKKPEVFEKLIK